MSTIPQEKRCSICREMKPLGAFHRDRTKHDGYETRCKACSNARNRKRRSPPVPRKPRARKQADPDATEKYCTGCKTTKPLTEFNKRQQSFDGYQPRCKVCDAVRKGRYYRLDPSQALERGKQWKTANGERYKELAKRHYLKKKYGMTQDAYNELLEQQGWRCAICGTEYREKKTSIGPLEIDHDHQTGAVRGLLCRSCNMGIGIFADSIELLRAAIAYIERAKERSSWRGPV